MDITSNLLPILTLAGGAALGALIVFLAIRARESSRRASNQELAESLAYEILKSRDAERQSDIDRIMERMKSEFGDMSLEALGRANEALVSVAKQRLEGTLTEGTKDLQGKKELIDLTLGQLSEQMNAELNKVAETIRVLEKDREGKFSELAAQLQHANSTTRDLSEMTGALREVLASSKARGEWGERMAEDVLNLAGFREGLNYLKQKTQDGSGQRPDFTFLLPNNLCINMDVKFPLDNYTRYCEAQTDDERQRYQQDFVRDARRSLKQITTREYIDPARNTIDCVLLFVPNEQVYGFLHESDSSFVDDAVRNHVVVCSPFTLYAVIALIRQSFDNFNVERTSREILELLNDFQKQWGRFKDQLEKMGRRIEDAQREYEGLVTTRSRSLDRSLSKLEELRERRAPELNGSPTSGQLELQADDESIDHGPRPGPGGDAEERSPAPEDAESPGLA